MLNFLLQGGDNVYDAKQRWKKQLPERCRSRRLAENITNPRAGWPGGLVPPPSPKKCEAG